MRRERIFEICDALMKEFGLTDWTVRLVDFRRATSGRMGLCKYGERAICIGEEHLSDDEITETIIHEIAHALAPGAGHGPRWEKSRNTVAEWWARNTEKILNDLPNRAHGKEEAKVTTVRGRYLRQPCPQGGDGKMLRWPDFSRMKPATDQVGDAIQKMTEREIAQSAANQRALQQARADAAKRQQAEERLTTAEVNRGR